jgi:GH24 family phage-related lysozyme (muramidase)
MSVLEALGMGGANSGDSGSMTPESLAIRRKLAQAMMSEGMDASPIASNWQGLNRVAQALIGGYNLSKTEREDKAGQAEANAALISAFAPSPAAPAAGAASAAQPLPVMGRPAHNSPAGGAMAAAGRPDDSADIYAPIRRFEGFTPTAKWDYKQNSGGYGTKAQPGQTFTRDQAEAAMRTEADPIAAKVRQLNPNATPSQVAALTSFGYNLGPGVIDDLAPDIQAGNWDAIARKMPQYNHAGGEVLPALTDRRGQEAAMLTGGGGAPAVAAAADRGGAMRAQAIKLMANPRTADMGKQMLMEIMKRDVKGPEAAERGTTPHAMTDADGNLVYGTIGKDGTWKPLSGASGYKPSPRAMTSDTGTEIITRDAYGNELRRTPKDVAGKERQEEIGKAQGQAIVDLPRVENNARTILETMDSLEGDPYLPRMIGPMDSRMPNWSGDSARVQSKLDKIQGQTFLQAFTALKGAGAITDIEGRKATDSLSRLQALGVNDQDYPSALAEFRNDVGQLVEVARAKTRGGGADQPRAVKTLRYNAQTGELE